MKLPIQRLKVRLRQMPPLTLAGMGMLYVLLVAITDTACPSAMSFSLFYLLGVTLVGWYSGSRRAVIAVSLASAIALALDELLRTDAKLPTSVAAWNVASRLAVFLGTGWLTVEISRLTRNLERLVEERTGQWKAEAEQHKATSTRLTEALDRFEQVINNITEVFWLSDVTKNEMAYISPGYEHVWGRKCADLYREPKSWAAALHPADREGVFRRAQTDQAAGTYDVEYRILRPDGAMRWIHDRAFPVLNEQGEVYRIAGLAEDITERKRTQEMLQMQAAILENMAEGVVVADGQGVIVQMNPASERIWGCERNELLGQPVKVLSALPEPEATTLMEEVLAALHGDRYWRGTFKNRRKDGATIFCEAVVNRVEVQGRTLTVAVEQDVTERLRAQEQLQMQARVLESMAEAMLMTDETGMIVLTNPALDALLGYESGELTGKPLQMLTTFAPEAYRLRFKVAIEQLRAPDLAVEEYVVRRKGGALIQVEARASGLRLGNRCFLVLVGQDITERKRAEQALRQSEETLRVFLDAVPEPAMLLDREGTILLANQALAYSLGRLTGELVGQYAFGFLPARLAETRKAMFDQIVRTRKAARYEDARAGRHFLNFESPVLDAAGNVTRMAVFALDITSRKEVESALAKQEALYRTLFELSPNGILLEDASGNILDVNQAICESSGYTRQELLGSNVRRLVPAENQSVVEAHLAMLRAGPPQEHEVWNLRKSSARRLIRLNEKLITLPDGSQRILVVTSDLTERRRSELTKEVFLSLGTKLGVVTTPVEAARAIYATADQFWKWDAATLDLYSLERDSMEPVLFCDVIDGQRRELAPLPSAGGPPDRSGRSMRQGAELILRQPADMESTTSVRFGDTSRLSASLMFVALHRGDQPIGDLSIQSYTPNAYTQEDLRTLQALADHCAGALARIRAEAALREAHDQLERRVQERTNELQAANAALATNEARLELALDASNAGTWTWEVGSKQPIWWDGRFHELYGFQPQEPVSFEAGIARLHPEDRERFLARHWMLLEPGVSDLWNEEFRVLHPVKGERWMASLGRLERDAAGRAVRVAGIDLDITERKLAEAALREARDTLEARVKERTAELQAANAALTESEERYRALAESSPDAIFILDRDLKVQYVNQRGAALWRRAPKELIGLTQSELFPPEEAKLHCRAVAEVFETGQAVRRDALATFPAGELWIEIGLVPLFGEPGTVSSVMGACRDITERKRAERQLAEALDLNQKMIAASTLGIAAYKASGECVFANNAMARITGGSISEVLQQNIRVLNSWQESGLLQLAEEALSQGQARLGEVYSTSSFGKTVWLDCHVAPFVSNGQPHLLLMVLDITERKRAEDAFKQAERLQRVILDTIPDPVWLKNVEGRFLACNQAFATFYGRPVESFLGKTLFDCVPPEAARSAREDTEVMTTRLSVVTEVPVTDAQSRARWHESIKSPLFNERDEVIGTVGIARDVTERRRLERQILEISDREQARIGQDIHDGLCQQLVSLAFDANSLQSALSGQGRPEVKTARRIADCLDQAITETRQLSRGLFPVRLETDGLPPALEELAKTARARFKIQCHFHSQGPVAVQNAAIATHLYRIAQEALTNAIKHSQARNVSIRLKAGAKQIELRVEDDGAGLPPAKRTKATGMGLHIMNYRARAIGGTFHFGPGRRGGTVVSCCIPRGSS